MKTNICFFLLFTLAAQGIAQTISRMGEVRGTVRDETGALVPGVPLRLVRQFEPSRRDNIKIQFSARTSHTGDYQFPFVEPGQYVVCIETTGSGYLDPCQWGYGLSAIDIQSGSSRALHLSIRRGFWLSVEVNDPQGLLDDHEQRKTPAAEMIIGTIGANGTFRPANVKGKTRIKRELAILVPRGVPVKLFAKSSFFALSDESGAGVADKNRGHKEDVLVPLDAKSEDVPVRRLRIVGLH